jgi:hypothetical protein
MAARLRNTHRLPSRDLDLGRESCRCPNGDDLGEAEAVNLPRVTAGRGDICYRRPCAPRRSGRGACLNQVQLRIQVRTADSLDWLSGPVVVQRPAEEKDAIPVELASANPNRSCVGGIGDPENLVAGGWIAGRICPRRAEAA